MRFMIMVKATRESEAGLFPPDKEKLFADMATYHEELKRAGMLLDGSGLQPSSASSRISARSKPSIAFAKWAWAERNSRACRSEKARRHAKHHAVPVIRPEPGDVH